jgi:hypothetical protein
LPIQAKSMDTAKAAREPTGSIDRVFQTLDDPLLPVQVMGPSE